MPEADEPAFTVAAPPGGWAPPWPQAVELADTLPVGSWMLVGGLMVQLYAWHAGLVVDRPTRDVDMVLAGLAADVHAGRRVQGRLRTLGYELLEPGFADSPAHRFVRGEDQVDVMVADHLGPGKVPEVGGRGLLEVPGGHQAVERKIRCAVQVDGRAPVQLTLPDPLGALVLKAAAWTADSRDRDRHLDDTVVLAAVMPDPLRQRVRLKGSDRRRLLSIWKALEERTHRSWEVLEPEARDRAHDTLRVLTANPQGPPALPKRRRS